MIVNPNLLLLTLQALVLAVWASPSTVCGDIVNHEKAAYTFFNATQVYDCLTSVPFNAAVASRLLQYLNDTIQFHSTLAYLASPPPSYKQPAVDLVAGIAQIQNEIDDGTFLNEYAFEATVKQLLNAAHDDHLGMTGGILSAFVFGSPIDLVSVSSDGIELPKVYVASELLANETRGLPWQPSAIATINGEDVIAYLTRFAVQNSFGKLEPHADWNMLMRSGALDAQGYLEVFYGGVSFYPGDSITVTFENGTVRDPIPWQAVYLSPEYTGPLQTGGDFYNFFVLGLYPASYKSSVQQLSSAQPASTTSIAVAEPTSEPTSWDTAYPPEADVTPKEYYSLLRGYFLTESSLAVLSIPQFTSYGDGYEEEFVKTIKEFLKRSKGAGLKRVVIDVQQNMGGQPLLAIETFKLFFPSIEPFAASRRRAHPMADALGATLTPRWERLTPNQSMYYHLLTNEWVVTNRLDADTGREFTSWDDFFGPASSYNGDNYTKTEQYNLTSTVFTQEAGGISIDDLGETQLYSAEDIIILSDGLCSSACALFMELMHHQGHVYTVVAGGRPNYTPMQAPGGTRGAAAYGIDRMDRDIRRARRVDNSTRDVLPTRGLDFFINTASVNLRDQVRHSGNNIPIQFLDEEANCRIFFTPKTWYNYTNLWVYAAEAAWHNPKLCVAKPNSTPSSSSNVTTPHQVEISFNTTTTSYQVEISHNKPIPDSEDYQAISDPSNDLHAGPKALRSSNGDKCGQDNYCPGRLVCGEIPVCHKGKIMTDKRCVPECVFQSGQKQCNSDASCVLRKKDKEILPEDWGRHSGVATGYCKPIYSPRCNGIIDWESPSQTGLDFDDCSRHLEPDMDELDCFDYAPNEDLKRCHVWDWDGDRDGSWRDVSPRYCSAKDLMRWREEVVSSCYRSEKDSSVICGEGTKKPGPVVWFHYDNEDVYFSDPETGEVRDTSRDQSTQGRVNIANTEPW